MEYSPNKMNQFLNNNSFNFKKKFGQNFIIDENIIDKIVDSASVDKDTMVIEIGPGAGSLTYKLAKNAKQVLCYEIDTTLDGILKETLKDYDNVDIIFDDFLKRDVNEDLKKYDYKKLYVVANLPYYITTPIITKIIEDEIPVGKVVIMVQKEVGDRFKAEVGTKDYNSLTIYLNYYFDIRKVMIVSKNVFLPKPRIDSMVLEFNRKEIRKDLKNPNLFFKLVRDSFTQKRKTLRNNLKNYDFDKIKDILLENNYSEDVRAEALPIEIFKEISNKLS